MLKKKRKKQYSNGNTDLMAGKYMNPSLPFPCTVLISAVVEKAM